MKLPRNSNFWHFKKMASQEPLQSRFSACLDSVGYKKEVGALPASLQQNRKLVEFVEWAVGQIHPDNALTPEETKRYEALKSAGENLEGHALEDALKKMGQGTQKSKDIEKEVADMEAEMSCLKKQLQTLSSVQKSLHEHYGDLLHERDELTCQKLDVQKQQHTSQKKAQEGSKQIDAALEDLAAGVRDLCDFHQQEGVGLKETSPPRFLSDVSQDNYHQTEDHYLSELIAYTKKQFFKGLADLAHSQAPGEVDTKFTQVDLDDSAQVILRGMTEEQHQSHRKELSRLQALYPLTEVNCINAQLSERYAHAATVRAEQEMEILSTEKINCDTLRHHFTERQQRVNELREKLQELGRTQLTGLLQDMAALQVTRVLHGDYDLKIARQDYFTSKQDKVISHLQSQRSRHELLSMLYEVELRKHRDTHRLLTTTEKELTELKEERERRNKAMQNPALKRVETPRLSIDSNDSFAHRLCAMLGVQPSSDVPLLTHASLQKAVEQLAHQVSTLQGLLLANDTEIKKICQKQESIVAEFERELFGHNGQQVGQPLLTVEDYAEQCSKLSLVVTSLEQSIKKLLKDYDGKKKILKVNPLLETERKLFVYFFTNPAQLSYVLSELAKRVDSLALANNTASN